MSVTIPHWTGDCVHAQLQLVQQVKVEPGKFYDECLQQIVEGTNFTVCLCFLFSVRITSLNSVIKANKPAKSLVG